MMSVSLTTPRGNEIHTCYTDSGEYYAAVAQLGLRRSMVPDIFLDLTGEIYSVPNPARFTPEERAEIIEKLRTRVGEPVCRMS
jgi:hypothetical protein